MSAFFMRNGTKTFRAAVHNSLCFRRHSVADSIGAPITRTSPQHSNAYAKFPNSNFRRARELELTPNNTSSSNCSSDSAVSLSKSRAVAWYLSMLKSRPILTKSITCACIYTAADLSSQTISRQSLESYDFVRTLRMAGYGMMILGPSLHFWFNFVSKILPKRDLLTTFKKIIMGQTLYGPVMTVVFFSVNAVLQGESSAEIGARLKRDVVPTMISGVMYWPICDFITFKFIPVHLQPLVSNSFSYLWTVYLTYMASLEKATPSS